MEENSKPEDTQQSNLLQQQEEIKKRREAVLLRQKELQQKSSSQAPPWQDTINQSKPWQPETQTQQTSLPAQALNTLQSSDFRDTAQPTFREENVKNAVEFLTDSRVMSSTKEKKSGFLRSKGLTQPEIDEAFRRADLLPQQQPQQQQQLQQQTYSAPIQNNNHSPMMPSRPMVRYAQSPGQVVAQMPWKALAFLLVICAGIGGAISWLIKKYILNPRTKSVTESQDETIKNLQKKIDEVNLQLEKQSEEMKNTLNYIHSFLQNKKEFPRDNLEKNESLKSVIQEVTDTCNYSLYNPANRLPESPFIKNFPELKSDLVYAKQILATATNTHLLDIPKKTTSTLKNPNPYTSTPLSTLNAFAKNTSISPNGLPQKTPVTIANAANKVDTNWLYQSNKRSQSEKTATEKSASLDSSSKLTPSHSTSQPLFSTKDEEKIDMGKQENIDFLKT